MPVLLVVVLGTGVLLARIIHVSQWRQGGWASRAHLSAGWALVVLGLVHVTATWFFFSELSGRALWFASGGIAMSLGGAINLLQRLYAGVAPGVSPACVAGNVALTVLAAAFVAMAGPRIVRDPQFPMLLGLLIASTSLSFQAARLRRSNL